MRQSIAISIDHAIQNGAIFTINVDETTDEREKSILNIILRFCDKVLLLESIVLKEPANHLNVANNAKEVIVKYNLKNNLGVYLTDNTAYCLKSYEQILKPMYPTMIWIGC